MKHYQVVAAVIEFGNRFLCVERGKTRYAYTSFKYEFPGGKIEPGETAREALHREIIEELNYDVSVGEELITVEHIYPDFSIKMTAFHCTAHHDHPTLSEHVEAQWLKADELGTLDWAEADKGIVEKMMKMKPL